MRNILVDHAREVSAEKRGGRACRVPMDQAYAFTFRDPTELIALDEALTRLSEFDPRKAQVIEMRALSAAACPFQPLWVLAL